MSFSYGITPPGRVASAVQSTVTAAMVTLPTAAVITIAPGDIQGNLLGAGLNVVVKLLHSPLNGEWLSAVIDNEDGTYAVTVAYGSGYNMIDGFIF